MKYELRNKQYDKKGELVSFTIVDTETGEIITPIFDKYTCVEDYENAGVYHVEPMTAKEYLNEEQLEEMLNSDEYYGEEKLDGTRGTIHFYPRNARVFSRRISKHTGWYVENTDSLPHIRELDIPDLYGTVIDGEMRIDGKEFKEVSSTLNCTWDKAIARQIELGMITLHAFDIIYYKGIYIAKMPLWKRKQYLEKVIETVGSEFIKLEPYTTDNIVKVFDDDIVRAYFNGSLSKEVYPNLYETIRVNCAVSTFEEFMEVESYAPLDFTVEIDKRTWYEYILYHGGEGLMLKSIDGVYKHTRGREFTKWKKFITRDCVIMGFSDPTKEYDGKNLDEWGYWVDKDDNLLDPDTIADVPVDKKKKCGWIPVTKFYALNWVGNIQFGVVVTDTEITTWEKVNKTKAIVKVFEDYGQEPIKVLQVGECGGFNEEQRAEFTVDPRNFIGKVTEILANEIFTKTGKLRHPRFLRLRHDKNADKCIWKDHVEG